MNFSSSIIVRTVICIGTALHHSVVDYFPITAWLQVFYSLLYKVNILQVSVVYQYNNTTRSQYCYHWHYYYHPKEAGTYWPIYFRKAETLWCFCHILKPSHIFELPTLWAHCHFNNSKLKWILGYAPSLGCNPVLLLFWTLFFLLQFLYHFILYTYILYIYIAHSLTLIQIRKIEWPSKGVRWMGWIQHKDWYATILNPGFASRLIMLAQRCRWG